MLTNITETRNFLGLAGYYRVSGRICQRASSQINLLKDSKKIKWQLMSPHSSSLMRETTLPVTQD